MHFVLLCSHKLFSGLGKHYYQQGHANCPMYMNIALRDMRFPALYEYRTAGQ